MFQVPNRQGAKKDYPGSAVGLARRNQHYLVNSKYLNLVFTSLLLNLIILRCVLLGGQFWSFPEHTCILTITCF